MSCKNDNQFAASVALICTDTTTDYDTLAAEQAAVIIADMKTLYRKLLDLPEAGPALTALATERIPLTARGEREGDASEVAHKYLPGIADEGPAQSKGQWLRRELTARFALRIAEVVVRGADDSENPALRFLLAAALACEAIEVDKAEESA